MIIDDFYINYNILFVTSRYLATGDAITIAYNLWTGVSTARPIILDVCMAIWDVLVPIYMPVPSEDPLQVHSMRDGTFPIIQVLGLMMANML